MIAPANTATAPATPEDAPELAAATTRVVLVDARPERRAVMRQMFEHSNVGATVVAEADSTVEAVVAVERHGADVVVTDLRAPVRDGLDAVAELRGRYPALVILVCSFNTDPVIRRRALDGGADAYLFKPVSAREVMATVRAVVPRAGALQSSSANN